MLPLKVPNKKFSTETASEDYQLEKAATMLSVNNVMCVQTADLTLFTKAL